MLFDVTLPNALRQSQSHAHESDHLQSLFQYPIWSFYITTLTFSIWSLDLRYLYRVIYDLSTFQQGNINRMMKLEEIKNDKALLNAIDWEMTPEEAIRLYLEWGNNWAGGNYVIRSKNDVTHYFVVNTWEQSPKIYLIRRNSEEAEELAEIDMPKDLSDRYLHSIGYTKGVYSIEGEVKAWIQKQLDIEDDFTGLA